MGYVTLDFKKILISPSSFYWAFDVLKQPTPNAYQLSFYWAAASGATSCSPVASVQSLICTPGSLTNKNLSFAFSTNHNLEFVALSGCH
jgi:hypothetical protein